MEGDACRDAARGELLTGKLLAWGYSMASAGTSQRAAPHHKHKAGDGGETLSYGPDLPAFTCSDRKREGKACGFGLLTSAMTKCCWYSLGSQKFLIIKKIG